MEKTMHIFIRKSSKFKYGKLQASDIPENVYHALKVLYDSLNNKKLRLFKKLYIYEINTILFIMHKYQLFNKIIWTDEIIENNYYIFVDENILEKYISFSIFLTFEI